MSKANRCASLLGLAAASLALAACGGSSTHSGKASATESTPSSLSGGPGSAVSGSSGQVRATLKAENHTPKVKEKWIYTVTAADAHGHPLSGTVTTEFAFQGTVVGRETPPTHPLKHGRLKDNIEYPAKSVGYPVDLQVVVHTHLGSVTLRWPVRVHK